RSTEAAKAAIAHYCAARNWTALSEFLKRKDTLYYLTKLDWDNVRAAWMKLLLHSDENVPNLILSLI
ncbi:MAG: hypothetical protein IKR40_09245, partial [Treponema sp.]|nr:hypothetical protein [Treponema sp.]